MRRRPRVPRSAPAKRLVELQVGDRCGEPRPDDAHVVVLEHAAERDSVEQGDGGSRCSRLLPRAAEDLPGRNEPSGRGWSVMMEGTTEIADALPTHFAPILANHHGGTNLVRSRAMNGRKMRLTARSASA